MSAYVEMFEPAFQRPEQLGWSKNYMQGLLEEAVRKNVEQIALELGKILRSMQH